MSIRLFTGQVNSTVSYTRFAFQAWVTLCYFLPRGNVNIFSSRYSAGYRSLGIEPNTYVVVCATVSDIWGL